MALIPLEFEQEVTGDFGSKWVGYKLFTCPKGEVDSHVQSLKGTSWVFNPGWPAIYPTGIKVKYNDPDYPENSLLRVKYSFFNIGAFPIGRATMHVKTIGRMEKMEKDLDNKLISGRSIKEDNVWWKVEGDQNIELKYLTQVVFRTAYYKSSIRWNRILSRMWHVNRNAFQRVGASPRTMLMTHAEVPRYVLDASGPAFNGWGIFNTPSGEIIPIEYGFLYNPDKWPLKARVHKYTKKPQSRPILHHLDSGDPTNTSYAKKCDLSTATGNIAEAAFRTILVDGLKDKVKRWGVIKREADFSDVYGLLSW